MNPQQYYQVSVSAGMQDLPAQYGQARLLQNAALAGGLHVVPPPPPPAVMTVQQPESECADSKPVAETEHAENAVQKPQNPSKSDPAVDEVDAGETTETSIVSSPTTAKILPSAVNTVPAQVAMQATAPAGLMGGVGVYAGAYIQQAAGTQPGQLPQAVPQYMFANQALQPAAQASKVMVLPQYYPGVGGSPSPYMVPSAGGASGLVQPTLVTDHTGKTYLVNYQPQQQVQYYAQPPAAAANTKTSVPGLQFVMNSPQQQQYYAAALHAQASASLQPVYARSQPTVPGAQSLSNLGTYPAGAVPGVPPAPGTAPASGPLYYYYQ